MKPLPWKDDTLAANGRAVQQNFADWFDGSRVTEADGTPKVLFHGTAADLREFNPAKVGSRHVDLEIGEAYYFTDDINTANWYAQDSHEHLQGGANVMPVFLRMNNPLIVDFQGTGIETLGEDLERAKRQGHDGLIAHNYDDGGVADHYIAFSASQIKSAIGNSGLYLRDSVSLCDRQSALELAAANRARNVLDTVAAARKAVTP